MSRYERAFGTDWEALTENEAVDRAYALGVAASLGEYHPDELDAIRDQVDTAYSRSLVDLAFDQGKSEGTATEDTMDSDDEDEVWEDLIAVDPPAEDEEDSSPVGGRSGLPEAIDVADALDTSDAVERTEAIDRPEFLEKD